MSLEELKDTCFIVDLLAHEYGWSIEYIQELELPEIRGLIRAILDRQDAEDIRMQINVAKAFSGKISSNRPKNIKKFLSPRDSIKEVKNLRALAKLLKVPIHYTKLQDKKDKGK